MYSHLCDGEKDCKDGSDEEGCAIQCKAGALYIYFFFSFFLFSLLSWKNTDPRF